MNFLKSLKPDSSKPDVQATSSKPDPSTPISRTEPDSPNPKSHRKDLGKSPLRVESLVAIPEKTLEAEDLEDYGKPGIVPKAAGARRGLIQAAAILGEMASELGAVQEERNSLSKQLKAKSKEIKRLENTHRQEVESLTNETRRLRLLLELARHDLKVLDSKKTELEKRLATTKEVVTGELVDRPDEGSDDDDDDD